ncbi:MAG: dockerin type I repeat-containing protein [Muribaculaceae bacterium]|nr:dockerin type I repeat-containing protein [Muribaculaceae bacterium]
MKKTLLLLTLALAVFSAKADNYFTMGENDTLRIKPTNLGGFQEVNVRAHLEGRIDYWFLDMSYKNTGLNPSILTPRSGMTVHYFTSSGTDSTIHATLDSYAGNTIITSCITEIGYWDYNGSGNYAPYGTVKWEAGDYESMFSILYQISANVVSDTITIDGTLRSGDDARHGTIPYCKFYKTVTVIVGYRLGDVNGDDFVDIHDVSALVSYLLTDEGLDQYQLEAADFNQDGYVTLDDVTALTNYLLTS